MTEQQKLLQERLDQNYAAYITGLQGKTADELIALAPEITAAQQVRDELADACDEDDIAFLLRYDDPLELVRGYWEGEITGYDHSGEMGHTLWRIREDVGDDIEQQSKTPIAADEIAIDPVMDFTGKEIVAYVEIGFDVMRRFPVCSNIDDICDLYVKYDPVSNALRGELCIMGYEDKKRWEPVEFLPEEQEVIIGMMEEACRKDGGKALRETWMEHHPVFSIKNLQEKKHGRKQNER